MKEQRKAQYEIKNANKNQTYTPKTDALQKLNKRAERSLTMF